MSGGSVVGARRANRSESIGAAWIFLLVASALLAWAKWNPAWQGGLRVAHDHAIGQSILTGTRSVPPPVSLAAGVQFALSYFGAVWPALVAGIGIAEATRPSFPRAGSSAALPGVGARSPRACWRRRR